LFKPLNTIAFDSNQQWSRRSFVSVTNLVSWCWRIDRWRIDRRRIDRWRIDRWRIDRR